MSRTLTLVTITAIILLAGCSKQQQTNQTASATRNESASEASRNAATQPDPNAQPQDSPLMSAVVTGNAQETKRLLDSDVVVDAPSATGVTPLMNAAGMGNKEIAQMLISK